MIAMVAMVAMVAMHDYFTEEASLWKYHLTYVMAGLPNIASHCVQLICFLGLKLHNRCAGKYWEILGALHLVLCQCILLVEP